MSTLETVHSGHVVIGVDTHKHIHVAAVLDTIGGYFLLRTTLTVGVLLAIGWRLWLVPAAA